MSFRAFLFLFKLFRLTVVSLEEAKGCGKWYASVSKEPYSESKEPYKWYTSVSKEPYSVSKEP